MADDVQAPEAAHGFPPIAEIELRWTLRDIYSGRFSLMRLSDEVRQELVERGLIEMRDDVPHLTSAGLTKIGR